MPPRRHVSPKPMPGVGLGMADQTQRARLGHTLLRRGASRLHPQRCRNAETHAGH
ncbi:hypothetical protein [Nitrosomonas sp. Nm34]|uniref:hypothetical protein n=1 Tax=Nitrosomonas sp. Nm34 TaxID=1881055 RepID=UPI001587B6C0|nr:hypothetical protein [Nitrosomonas sp. Nm34]